MNLRPFNHDDLPAILEIYRQSKLDELRFENQAFTLLPLENDDIRLGQFLESDIFVYQDDGILGYCALFQSEIRALFVKPNARGHGIGKRLLEFLLNKTVGEASLYIAKTNAPAKLLYESYGFKVTEEFQTKYNGTPVFANKMVSATPQELKTHEFTEIRNSQAEDIAR